MITNVHISVGLASVDWLQPVSVALQQPTFTSNLIILQLHYLNILILKSRSLKVLKSLPNLELALAFSPVCKLHILALSLLTL